MKKFLPYILTIVLLVGIFIPTQFAHAGLISWATGINFPGTTEFVMGIAENIAIGILKLVSWITFFAGYFLNWVLKYTIVEMKLHLADLTGINTAWKVIRDLMNIAFIFLLVYEAIKLIIGQGSIQNIKKFITGIVLASLLINFSLFFTKVLIDASNIVTIGFYNSITAPPANSTGTIPESYGLSDPITKALGITSWYSANADPAFGTAGGLGGVLIMTLGSGLILLVSAFVFFAVAILFVIRYVTLIILLMLSPVAYMGMALPFMKGYADEWWESLKSQLLFAPIYMIMTWVILILMSSPNFVNVSGFAEVFNGDQTTAPAFSKMGLILNFVVIIGLLIASLVIAKKTARKGSDLIGKATGQLTSFAGGAIIGGAGRFGRATVGRAGNAIANSESLKDTAAKGNLATRNLAKFGLNTGNRAATSTFDARATKGFGTVAGAAGMKDAFGKVDLKKDNFRAQMEERDKAATKKAEQYKPSDLAVEKAKSKLNENTDEGKKFRDEEAEKKRARQIYINSDDYKNSAEYKKIQEEENNNRRDTIKIRNDEIDVRTTQQRLDNMRREMDTYADNTPQKIQIQARIKTLQDETQRKQSLLRDLQVLVASREKFLKESEFDVNTWMSEEKKSLIATAGGNKEIKSAFQQRVNAQADRVENASPVWRWTANTLGTVTNVAGITATPMTKTNRQELARKIRKVPEGKKKKSKKDIVEDLEKAGMSFADDAEETTGTATTPTQVTQATPSTGGGTPSPAVGTT